MTTVGQSAIGRYCLQLPEVRGCDNGKKRDWMEAAAAAADEGRKMLEAREGVGVGGEGGGQNGGSGEDSTCLLSTNELFNRRMYSMNRTTAVKGRTQKISPQTKRLALHK